MPTTRVSQRPFVIAAILLTTIPTAAFSQDIAFSQGKKVVNSDKLEEIVVTGEKQNRSLMKTASSVAVTTAKDLVSRAGLDTTADLLARIPNLVGTETSNLAPAVRGIDGTGPAQGADAFFAGTRSRLNYQVDGRTLSYNEAIFSDATLWDVGRVEVFRGPQSTLQGRNSIAGAIVIKTRNPTYDWEGAGRILAGNHDTRQGSVALSGPLVDNQLAFRFSADRRTSKSFVDFPSYEGVEKPGKFKALALRGKLLMQPVALPQLSALLTISYLDAYGPQSNEVVRPFGKHNPAFPLQPRFGTKATTGILDTTWEFNSNTSLQTVLSASDIKVNRSAMPGTGIAEINISEYVAEPRLNMAFLDQHIEGFVGVHVFRSHQDEAIDLFGGGTFKDSTKTNALFGEATVHITDSVDVTFGGRYEREERDRDGADGPFVISFHHTYKEFLPKASVAWQVMDELRTGIVIARGYNGGGAGFTFDVPFLGYTFKPEHVWNYEFFWRASLMNKRLSLNGNVFFNDYENLQLPFDLNPDPDVWSYVVRNADKAVTYGAEVNGRFLVVEGLELFAGAGVLDTEIKRYPGSGVEGNDLARSPSFSANFGFSYIQKSGFEISADARYSGSYYTEAVNNARGRTAPYWVANSKIAYNFKMVRLFASITNIFDNGEPVMLYPGVTQMDDTATILQPRTFTAGLQFSF